MSSSGGEYPGDHDIEDVVGRGGGPEREGSGGNLSHADTTLTEILDDLQADYADDSGNCILGTPPYLRKKKGFLNC